MAILRVRDENGNIIEIPAIKGEKGDKGDPGDVASVDVQLNGASIVQDGVANIPQMANGKFGVAQIWNAYGVDINDSGYLMMAKADTNNINSRDANYRAIVPTNLDYAVKAALTDGKGPEYTPEEQLAARERLGVVDVNEIYIGDGEMPEGCVLRINPEGEATPIVNDVTVNDTSIVTDGVANIPHNAISDYFATERIPSTYSIANGWTPLYISNGILNVREANDAHISNRTNESNRRVLTSNKVDSIVRTALCDGKGEAYTSEEKASARERLGLEWRYIGKVQTTEEVLKMSIDIDNEGNPFSLRKVRIVFVNKPNSSDLANNLVLTINDKDLGYLGTTTAIKSTNFAKCNEWVLELYNKQLIKTRFLQSIQNNEDTYKILQIPNGAPNVTCLDNANYLMDSINQIGISSMGITPLIGSGAYMEIWGVDA